MKKTVKVRLVLIMLTAILLVGCGLGGRNSGSVDTIKIGYLPITHAGPLYFEKEFEDEYFKGRKIELIKFGSWIELMDALNTGRIDGASVLFELAMKAKEKGIDLKAVALGHRDGNAIIAGHTIDSVSDLKDETVAIPHTLSSHNILLEEMLHSANMTYHDVNIIELPPSEMPAALSEGRISSYVVAEPFGALGVTLNAGHVLYQSNELWPDSLCCALVLRNDFIVSNPEVAQEFVNGYIAAGEHAEYGYSEKDNRETHMNYLSVNEDALNLSLKWISYDNLYIQKDDYEYLRKRMLEMHLTENPPTYEEFIDQSLFQNLERSK